MQRAWELQGEVTYGWGISEHLQLNREVWTLDIEGKGQQEPRKQ